MRLSHTCQYIIHRIDTTRPEVLNVADAVC